jgi:hypothetical protein
MALVKHHTENKEAFVWPLVRMCVDMADDTPDNRVLKAYFRTATNIHYVFNRRSRDGRNVPHMEQIEDENYTVSLFIRLLGPDEVSTDNLMNTWGRQLADQFNIIGADPAQYRYPFTTKYVGPLTPGPDLNNHRYVARYLLDTDICTIICRLYDTIPVTELVENTDLMAAYFGPNPARVAAGIAILLRFGIQPEFNDGAEPSDDEEG